MGFHGMTRWQSTHAVVKSGAMEKENGSENADSSHNAILCQSEQRVDFTQRRTQISNY